MKQFKFLAVLMSLAALALCLAACMNTAEEPRSTVVPATQSPASMETAAPGASFMPDTTARESGANAGQGTNQAQSTEPFDWRANASRIEDSIDQISEISESRVVVAGNTALVGVKFASAYQGEMTERIREMIAGVVREADPSIQTVAVTAEAGDVDAVYGFAEQIQSGKNGDSLAEDINRIVRNITTLR